MSEHILTHTNHTHQHQAHNHAASGWRIHCGVEVTELSTNKQHNLSRPPGRRGILGSGTVTTGGGGGRVGPPQASDFGVRSLLGTRSSGRL